MDYSLLSRCEFPVDRLNEIPECDLFISAYNQSERVRTLFDAIRSPRKEWLVHPEYDFKPAELPTNGTVHDGFGRDEAEFWHQYFDTADFDNIPVETRISVDLTGFMRPHIMLLPRLLRDRGFTRLQALYSDPRAYVSGEKTPFTKGAVTEVRQVRGFEGLHEPADDADLLVIGAGYDHELIRRVAENKRAAHKLEMFGLPSLQPHMYEENRLRAAGAEEAIGPLPERSILFAPANDPFATAQELHDRIVEEHNRGLGNLYLSPLATKPQALGFALYYLCECLGTPTSIIFPYAEYYSEATSIGLARVWLYNLELDWFQ